MSILKIENLHSGYGAIKVLRNISLTVNKNEVVTILGPNGAGKTTLIMTIFNTVNATHGNVYFDNIKISGIKTHNISKLGVSLVPEGRRIFSKMSVFENLLLGSINQKKHNQKILENIFENFPILKERKNQRAGTLSGGEQQMLAIGRALISAPKLLILDEPSLGLSPKITMQIFQILKNISKKGTTILLIEQNVHHAINLADRFYLLTNGQIAKQGTKQDFLDDKNIADYYLGN